jgi:hypothetical protein
MNTAPLIKEISENRTSVTDSTHCINKATERSGSNDVNNTNQDVLNSPEGQNILLVRPILHRPSANTLSLWHVMSQQIYSRLSFFFKIVNIIIIIIIITAPQPFVGPWPLFRFLIVYTVGKDSLDRRSARCQAATYTQNNTNK